LCAGIVTSGSTASKGVGVVLRDNISAAADLSVRVKSLEGIVTASEGGSAGDLTVVDGYGDFVSIVISVSESGGGRAASLLGWIVGSVTAALEGVVVAADNAWVVRVTTAKLGCGVKSAVATALLVLSNTVGNNVVVGGDGGTVAINLGAGGGAAQVLGRIEGLGVTTAVEVVVGVGEDVIATANLLGAVEAVGSAASEASIDGSVVKGDNAVSVGKAALLVVSQEFVSTTLEVVIVIVRENGIDATEVGGGIERALTTARE
jgi:hypothetical protein